MDFPDAVWREARQWEARALAAEAELETLKRELKQSQTREHFWKMRSASLSTKDGAESVLTHFKGVS